jgi:hypothetical protein
MGVLDDAIREHIELKRRHGASETDLSRQEQEALGPARREAPAPAAPAVDEGEGELDADRALEPAADPAAEHFDVAPTDVAPTDVAPPPLEQEPDPEEAAFIDADPEAVEDLSPEHGGLADLEPFPDSDPLPAEPARDPDPDDPGEEEDVLEETPEFLQETPEHDRLWFEQKPPRDFDFDQ